MVLGYLPVPGRPSVWITVGQGPTALAVGAGGGCLAIFTFMYPFSPLSPSNQPTVKSHDHIPKGQVGSGGVRWLGEYEHKSCHFFAGGGGE